VQAFRTELDAALDRGRSGLRVAADITALAAGSLENRRQLHVYERLADTLIGSSPLTGMCLYDAALGDEVLGPLSALHPVQHHGDRQPLAHLSGRGPRLALHGEIADHRADEVFTALFDLACAAPGEVELDLSSLDFLDLAGARSLARTARLLTEVGVRLRPVSAQPLVARVLSLADLRTAETTR
jgi:anti-anti-sigma factor